MNAPAPVVDPAAPPRCEVQSVVVTRQENRTIVHVTFLRNSHLELAFTDALADSLEAWLVKVRAGRDDELIGPVVDAAQITAMAATKAGAS